MSVINKTLSVLMMGIMLTMSSVLSVILSIISSITLSILLSTILSIKLSIILYIEDKSDYDILNYKGNESMYDHAFKDHLYYL